MSNAITDKPEERPKTGPLREPGPSDLHQDEPTVARVVGSIGAALVIFGGMALMFSVAGYTTRVGPGLALFLLCLGMGGLLYHSVFDQDIQFRRMYGLFSAALLLVGLYFCLAPGHVPAEEGQSAKYVWGALMRWGVPALLLGMLFQFSFQRNEEDRFYLEIGQYALGGAGAVLAVVGLISGLLAAELASKQLSFFLPTGAALCVCGLVLLVSFVAVRGVSDDIAYYTALGFGAAGLLVVLIVLGRGLFTETGPRYVVNFGMVLVFISVAYAVAGASLALDVPFFTLFRRELAAFFVSPLSYVALFAFGIFAWFSYVQFLGDALTRSLPEPVVGRYILTFLPVFVLQFIPPAITMRLFSEESRAGTLEVLFTTPVEEASVVMAKFCAGLVTFLAAWAPFGLVLLAIPLSDGKFFDYRPMVSFAIVLVLTGAAFISVGLFFSSLTSDQVVSVLLSFGAMLGFTLAYFARLIIPPSYEAVRAVLRHMSYVDLWAEALQGKIILRHLVFFLSVTVLALFATVKVLESRKWR